MIKQLVPESLKKYYRKYVFSQACRAEGVDLLKLKFIGVTGTSGKTTTSSMIYHVMKKNGFKVGLISTVGVFVGDKSLQTGFHVTTPDPRDLVKFIKEMIESEIEYVVLETSSHALAQNRIGDIKFEFAIFTNIKSDHLDWHKTWESYAASKAQLIGRLNSNGIVIINKDDERSYNFLLKHIDNRKVMKEYSLSELANKRESVEGISFSYLGVEYKIPVLGEYNMSNALAVIKCCESLPVSNESIAETFSDFVTVEGRMEIFQKDPFVVVLDFAHNADSLEKSLLTAKKLLGQGGKLISIFGSAGLRDIEKRGEMGRISAEIADITIITAEDPRTESLFEINNQILKGAESAYPMVVKRFENHSEYLKYIEEFKDGKIPSLQFDTPEKVSKEIYIFDEESVDSRYDAIDLAVRRARKGDVVIPNGKGHEQSLAFGTTEYEFSDAKAIKRALANI